ncbi:HlyD family secretion protein [Klebsiella pneumoniae subsp. ozaenae]
MPRRQDNPYAPHDWAPHEKPALLGSPSTPLHSPAKRLAYGVVGLLVCLTGALGNAVVTANLQLLQGTFAAWSTEIAWLPAVYVMTNVSINLLLVKFRQQFGLRAFTEGFLVLYVLVTFFHLFVNDLSSAMMVRAAHGMVQSISPATGVEFSAISPDNATGNFVKIAQRIPVRITVNDGQNKSERLRPGMSVQVTIDTRAEKQP